MLYYNVMAQLSRLLGKSATVCYECAKEHNLMEEYYNSCHGVFPRMGPDSLCDVCGEENGGRVFVFPKNDKRIKE